MHHRTVLSSYRSLNVLVRLREAEGIPKWTFAVDRLVSEANDCATGGHEGEEFSNSDGRTTDVYGFTCHVMINIALNSFCMRHHARVVGKIAWAHGQTRFFLTTVRSHLREIPTS